MQMKLTLGNAQFKVHFQGLPQYLYFRPGIFGSINRIIRKPAGVLFVNSMSEIADQSAPLDNSLGSTNKEREILNRIIKIGMPAELTKDKYKARSSGGFIGSPSHPS